MISEVVWWGSVGSLRGVVVVALDGKVLVVVVRREEREREDENDGWIDGVEYDE